VTDYDPPRPQESQRFGSRAWARELLNERGQLTPSGRHVRAVERHELALAAAPTVEAGRRRLLPFQVQLMQAGSTAPIFQPGPLDELTCHQRLVGAERHRVEFLSWLSPYDQGSEGFRPFGVFRFSEAQPLPDLRRRPAFWRRLREECGLKTIPGARVRGQRHGPDGAPRQGRLEFEPAMGSGPFRRSGQPKLDVEDVREVMRRRAGGLERVAWLEEAFGIHAPQGRTLHRYYLDADLTAYLVRHHRDEKTVCTLTPSAEARAQGLLIYPGHRPLTEWGRLA
jgi:hypothetical protein